MDTKPLEDQAESFIKSELIKHGFNITKPCFDKEGADLLIVESINNQFTKILKIQCKGRTLNRHSTSIKIPVSYVTEDFLVFLYVVNEELEHKLFTFFESDIEKWKVVNSNYTLNLSEAKLHSEYFLSTLFNKNAARKISNTLKEVEIEKYTSVLIDGIFLEKAITKTISIYSLMYPDRKLQRPSIKNVVCNILSMYDTYNSHDKVINCYIYYYEDNPNNSSGKSEIIKFDIKDDINGKIYIDVTDEFVWVELIEYLNRIVNTENVIMVADDLVYEIYLNRLKERNIDVTLVMYSSYDGRRMFTDHKWGDIVYPIAKSIGIERQDW